MLIQLNVLFFLIILTYIGIGISLFYGLGSIGALMACLSVKNVMLLTKKNVGFMA